MLLTQNNDLLQSLCSHIRRFDSIQFIINSVVVIYFKHVETASQTEIIKKYERMFTRKFLSLVWM